MPGTTRIFGKSTSRLLDTYCHITPLDINYLAIFPTMMVAGDADGNYLFEEKYFPKSEAKEIFAGADISSLPANSKYFTKIFF